MEHECQTTQQKQVFSNTDVICCGVLERMDLGWMKLEDGTRCMPYIKGHSDGEYVRDVMVKQ